MPCLVSKQPGSMSKVEGDSNKKDKLTVLAESHHHHSTPSSLLGTGIGNSESVRGLYDPRILCSFPVEPGVGEVLKEGINTLIQLYRAFGQFNYRDGLKAFVDLYCERMLVTTPPSSPLETRKSTLTSSGSIVQVDSFSCPVCYGIFIEPVTIQCGHSYCRKCLQKERPGKSCRRCNHVLTTKDISLRKGNVLVTSLVEKWWPNYISANNLRSEGNRSFDENQGDEALDKYSQAIDICGDDHLSLGNRAQALLTLGRSDEALRDAEAAIKSCSVWAKGYFRKSVTLCSLGRYEEAFVTLTICLYLVTATKINDETAVLPLKSELVKVLHKIFLQSSRGSHSSSYRRHSTEQTQFSPYAKPRRVERGKFSDAGDGLEEGPVVKATRSSILDGKLMSRGGGSGRSLNRGSTAAAEQNSLRIHRIFERAVQERKRIQMEVIEKTKIVADPPEGSPNTSIRRGSILRSVDHSRICVNDFECTLCYRLLHQPLTTDCGHTFCRACLERCLDHSSACPLCKTSLQDLIAHEKPCTTYFVEIAMQEFFQEEKEERVIQHQEDLGTTRSSSYELKIPIFVCTIGFPSVPCPLHVFEPRYRLLIRRAIEAGSRSFGMCPYSTDGENNYAEIGTLLEIKNVQYFADGRSVVETLGSRRFKVLRKSQRDGYNTAGVELIQDRAVDPADRQRLLETHDQVYVDAMKWLKSISQVMRQRINTHFGQIPLPEENWTELQDGPAWAWWLVSILPIDGKAQLAILGMNNLQKRLESILKVLNFVTSNEM